MSAEQIINAEVVDGLTVGLLAAKYDNPKPIPKVHWEMWDLCCSGGSLRSLRRIPWTPFAPSAFSSPSACPIRFSTHPSHGKSRRHSGPLEKGMMDGKVCHCLLASSVVELSLEHRQEHCLKTSSGTRFLQRPSSSAARCHRTAVRPER